jgi:hypothetical protein
MTTLILDLEDELTILFSKVKHLLVFTNGSFQLDEMISGVISSVLDYRSAFDETSMFTDELSQLLTEKGYPDEADVIKDALWNFAIALINQFTEHKLFNEEELCPYVFDRLVGKLLFVNNDIN